MPLSWCWIWEMAFAYMDRPSAAVMTVLLIVLLAVIAVLQFRFIERRAHYQ